MQLKLWVLSGASVVLWLSPLVGLDKQNGWHKGIQGISLVSAIACAVSAGNIAKKQADEDEIEVIKARAIKADVIDEISTSVYVSQQSRQQEAEAILASPTEAMEEARERLEAIYSADEETAEVITITTTSEPSELDKSLYAEVMEARKMSKSATWIIENILKYKGRKFAEGKVKLQMLLSQFEGGNDE